MYKELIAQYGDGNKYVSPQPSAAVSEIAKAEQKLGTSFPDELRALLSEMNGDRWLMFSINEIIETTEDLRSLTEYYPGIDGYLFFAGNGCGDYYGYSVTEDGSVDASAIYLWLHETNEKMKVAADIPTLIKRYYSDEI